MKVQKVDIHFLESLDYKKIEKYRCLNYDILEEKIGSSNLLKIKKRSNDVPMVYPYLSNKSFLKNNLVLGKVYVATYWKNVFEWVEKTNVEYFFSKNLCPIPVDQRYCDIDMKKIIEMIQIDTQL